MKETNSKQNISFLLILGALMALTSLSTDIYLPAMPLMERKLGGSVQLTITGFLIGFAIAQIVWGPISDRFGRKKPLYIGMIIFVIGSIGCALSATMEQIIFWRIFQAIGACVGPMISRAMIRDLYRHSRAAQMLSTLTIIMAIAPIVGPIIGGVLVKFSSWELIFWLMGGIGLVIFFSTFSLPETLPIEKRGESSLIVTFSYYKYLLRSRTFMVYTFVVTFFYVGAYAFITGSSEVYINYFHIGAQYYGFLFGINIIGVSLVSTINRRLVSHFSLEKLLRISTTVAFVSSLMLTLFGNTGLLGVFGIILPMFFVFSMNGIIAACANAAALDSMPSHMVGAGAALLGSLQYGSGIVSSILLAIFKSNTPLTMTLIIAVAMLFSVTMAWIPKRS